MTSKIPSDKILNVLRQVDKPARYIGGEVNSVMKSDLDIDFHAALVFPDVYEMGESHIGLKLLYKILNAKPNYWAERVYAPWPDMEKALIRHEIPLFSLESRRPLKDFDLIGITLPYELVYTNILTILDRGQIPFWQKDRTKEHPFILGGGTCAFNPEPVAEFFDAIVVGDGEDLMLPIAEMVRKYKSSDQTREELLREMSKLPGVYVPSFFGFEYLPSGVVSKIIPQYPDYPGVEKATVTNLDQADYPTAPIVPNINVIHDRVGVEVQRGCVRGCRFCQAGYIYRPERQRSPDTVKNIVRESLKNTGHEEVSLLSLSVGDYEPVAPLLSELFDEYEKDCVSISLPATRTETLTPEIIEQIKRVRKTGFTIAPEAGTPRMRRLINKGNEREDLMRAVENVFEQGWRLIKFYYMCGLPLELDSDVLGIAEEAQMALAIGKKYSGATKINVSVSSFVPKPFTPFQWEPQLSIEEIHEKHELLRSNLRERGLNFKHHNVEMSYLEGVFSRGDRRLSRALMRAYELGCRFDEWEEQLDFPLWQQAFRDVGLDPEFYVSRRRPQDEIFPWDHLFIQLKKDFLWEEFQAAHDLAFMEDCSTHRCSDCGICDFRKVKNVNYQYSTESSKVQAHSTRRRLLKDEPEQSLRNLKANLAEEDSLQDLKTKTKLRIRFTKLGEAAFLSHLDVMRALRRAFGRAKIPVGFSKGFHPQVLMSLSPPQALGIESEAEFFDLELTELFTPEEFLARMNPILPAGIQITDVYTMEGKAPSLNGSLREQAYEIEFMVQEPFEMTKISEAFDRFQQSAEMPFQRLKKQGTKTLDLKSYIKDLTWIGPQQLRLVTTFEPTLGTIKPQEVLQVLIPEDQKDRVATRILKVDARFEEPQSLVS